MDTRSPVNDTNNAARPKPRADRRRHWLAPLLAGGLCLTLASACAPAPALNSESGSVPVDPMETPVDETAIALNQIQMIGSHNSYHIAPSEQILGLLGAFSQIAPGVASDLGDPATLNYTHPPLTTQLERGLRTFELDVWADTKGGKFAHPLLPQMFNLGGPRPTGMREPGIKVLHIQDIDFMSRCPTLIGCLSEMRSWSDSNSGHLPIIINIELEEAALPAPFDATKIEPFGQENLQRLDDEIRSVLSDRLITPDDIRGDRPDLRTALSEHGWPSLAESRGKFLFFIDNENKREEYLVDHPALAGRVLFTTGGEGQPDGAFLKLNDPSDGARIRELVEEGYMVRTRADDDVTRPLTSQRDTAFGSGAQVIHSDFPQGQISKKGYTVSFGTNPAARCNPVNTSPTQCRAVNAALREG